MVAAPSLPSVSVPDHRATDITLPQSFQLEAEEMDINVSQTCERGPAEELAKAPRQCWLSENREAIEAWNRHVAEQGSPLATYRRF